MSNWIKVWTGGNVVVEPSSTLELFSQPAGLPYPLPTVAAQSQIAGPSNYVLGLQPGTEFFYRIRPAGSGTLDSSNAQLTEILGIMQELQTRRIDADGLATGGGELTADLVIHVPKATQQQAEEGTADDVALTPLKFRQGLSAYLGTLPDFDPDFLAAAHADRLAAEAAANQAAANAATSTAAAATATTEADAAVAAASTFTSMAANMVVMANAFTVMANRYIVLTNP
jgi:hypothetical protein